MLRFVSKVRSVEGLVNKVRSVEVVNKVRSVEVC